MKIVAAIIPAVILLAAGCDRSGPDPYTDDVATAGHILLLSDEDARPIIEAEERVFESIYTKAQLDIRYLSEAELLKAMLNDSVRCVISSVAPGGEQEDYFRKRRLSAPSVPIYTDGIAVIANKAFPADHLALDEVRDLLKGGRKEEVRMALFPGPGSGVARTLRDSLALAELHGRSLPNVDSVVAQVARDPGTIGFLPFALISDLDDPHVRDLRSSIKLLAIRASASSPAILPSQSTLADGQYPLRREMRMVLTEWKAGLGTGFVSFVANHKGQRIILKLGVAPIKVPAREVEIVH